MSDPKYKFEYGISRIIRYQGKRSNFFGTLHRTTLFVNAILGSAAFVTIMSGEPKFAAWLTAVVAIVSSIDTVVGFSERSRSYDTQRKRYYDLYCQVVAIEHTKFRRERFLEKRLQIDRDSPPPRRVLDVICRNEEDVARGHDRDDLIYIPWWRKALSQIIDLPPQEWFSNRQIKGRHGSALPPNDGD